MSIMDKLMNWFPTIIFTGAASITITVIGWKEYTYYLKKRDDLSIPELHNANWVKVGHVEKLKIYPVAFGAELSRPSFQFTQDGMRMEDKGIIIVDRMFKVYDEKLKKIRTYCDLNGLEKISLTIVDNTTIKLHAPGMPPLNISNENIDKGTRRLKLTNWCEQNAMFIDCGEEAATWLNRYLKANTLRLLKTTYNPKKEDNLIRKFWELYVQRHLLCNAVKKIYPNLTNYIVMTTKTFDVLHRTAKHDTVATSTIRPNIIIKTSTSQNFVESKWEWIKIGSVILRKVTPVEIYGIESMWNNSKYLEHAGVYYGLFIPGNVEIGNDVYVPFFTNT